MPCAIDSSIAGTPFGRRRNLDHHVRPIDALEQLRGLGDGRVSIVSDGRRALQADVAVEAVGQVVHRAQDVRGALDIFDGQRPVDVLGRFALLRQRARGRLVLGLVAHRLFKDRRIRGDAGDALVPGQPAQLARLEHAPGDDVDPDALTLAQERLGREIALRLDARDLAHAPTVALLFAELGAQVRPSDLDG